MTVRLLVPAYGKQTNALYAGTIAAERALIDAGQADNNLSASFDYADYLAGKSMAPVVPGLTAAVIDAAGGDPTARAQIIAALQSRTVLTRPSSVTGVANTLTALAVVTIPAALLSTDCVIRATGIWQATNNGNGKTLQILVNEAGGGLVSSTAFFNAGGISSFRTNRSGAELAIGSNLKQQVGGPINSPSGVGGVTADVVRTFYNAGVGLDIIFAASIAVATDSVTLQHSIVEVLK